MLTLAGAIRASGGPTLSVAGPLYWLDISDATTITCSNETSEILTVADKSGNGFNFERRTNLYDGSGSYLGPTYMPARTAIGGPPSRLPYARFDLKTNLLVQATVRTTSPRTVFIVQNTTGNGGLGGIWGWWGNHDRGLRLIGEVGPDGNPGWGTPSSTNGLYQWVNWPIDAGYTAPDFNQSYLQNCMYWTDSTLFDQFQTWFNKEWGITTVYGSQNYDQTSLGVYYENWRWWAGGIGEVIVYDRFLSDEERQAVERYLKEKWLTPPAPRARSAVLIVR